MTATTFQNYLINNLSLTENDLKGMLDKCTIKSYKKNDFLLRANEYCPYTFFVEKGLLRQYSIDDKGKEHIVQFAPENWFISDRASSYFKQPSSFFIQAIEDTTVALVTDELIALLENELPEFAAFNHKLLHNHILHLQNRINSLLSASAESRYLDFINMYPDIQLRVPQIMVASFLGITPESLSRVRKQLAENYQNKTS